MSGRGITNPMFFIGVVEDILDQGRMGRVRVRAFGTHGTKTEVPTTDLPWATCVSGNYDVNHTPPPMGSFVFGMFLDGADGQHPLVLGLIPGQYVDKNDPDKDGYGNIPPFAKVLMSMFTTPKDIGEVQKSKLLRVENLDNTYVGVRDAKAVQGQKIADSDLTWSEPPPAYATRYPHNKIIETPGGHSIELDDTPGAERITINHTSGAYVEIDAIGTVKERAESDRYEINIGTRHESSGHSVVTINGNSHVYVKGNKTEEIMGNYKRIVHGENEVTVGGQSYHNVGGHLFMRGASAKIEGNADRVTIFGRNEVQIEAEKQINNVSGHIKNTAMLTFSAYANKAIRLTSAADTHIYAVGSIINTALGTSPVSLTPVAGSTGSQTSRGFSVTSPTFNVASALGSFTGVFNATSLNTATLLASTASVGAGNFGAVNTAVLAAPLPISSSPGSPCKPGPGRLIGIGAPTVTIPVLNPPGISSPVPSPVPGVISGVMYPQGNGPGFAATVLTSPLAALTGFDINILPEGGLGIPRIQMPEPASHGCSIVPNGYFALGYALGFTESMESEG